MSDRHWQNSAGASPRNKLLAGRVISSCLTCDSGVRRFCTRYLIPIKWPASGPIPKGCRLRNYKKGGDEKTTWSARITKDGNQVSCFRECKHASTCKISSIAHTIGPVLTSVDTGCDGHMASGTANLECGGFEPIDSQAPGGAGG